MQRALLPLHSDPRGEAAHAQAGTVGRALAQLVSATAFEAFVPLHRVLRGGHDGAPRAVLEIAA
jgi:hypothetical protein